VSKTVERCAKQELTAVDYAQQIVDRFPSDPARQLTVLIWWAQHDRDVWRALGIESWLDTLEPCTDELRTRLRSILDAAIHPQPAPPTAEERERAEAERLRFEEWRKTQNL